VRNVVLIAVTLLSGCATVAPQAARESQTAAVTDCAAAQRSARWLASLAALSHQNPTLVYQSRLGDACEPKGVLADASVGRSLR
jgi:hypothetical protein